MATPASEDSAVVPVPDEGGAAPVPSRWSTLPWKVIAIVSALIVTLTVCGAAAYAFWPSDPQWHRSPVQKVKLPKKAARPAPAASSPVAAASAASVAQAASAPEAAASEPEHSLDRLQRRLAEALGGEARLEAGGGELKVLAGRAHPGGAAMHDPASPRASAPEPSRPVVHRAGAAASGQAHGRPARDPDTTRGGVTHWSYAGAGGPQEWHRLQPEFAKCGIGTRQSPIDIRDGLAVQMDPIRFDYRPSDFRVIDNGHTVQVNLAPGNFMEVEGRRYALRQFHFHQPSEERVGGQKFDMDVHLVHEDERGRLAVVAVLLQRGAAHPVVQAVWNSLPLEKQEEQPGRGALDLLQLLPAGRGYFMYMGSLTTPPCNEGVLWLVLKQPVTLSEEQVAIFSRLYPMNARPLQPSGGRIIKESN